MAKALYPRGKTVRVWLFPAVIFLGVLLYAVVKYGGPVWVDHAFMHGQVSLLNNLFSLSEPRPLEFYLGTAQQEIFGPISQAIAAIVFILFSLRYLKGASLFRFIIWTGLFLLLTKPEVLGFPPYGDAIGGPFAEAIWLKSNHFNYAGLLQQPDYAAGGPRVYVFSIYPTYLALWMAVIKNPAVYFPLMHLVVFLMTATVAGLLREMLRKEFSEDIAILASAVFLFAPLVQAQTEALNMEPPCMFFIMLCAFFLSQKKIGPAAVFAILAAAQKGLGIMACWAVGLAVILLWVHDPLRKRNGWKYLMV
ncbi:MAG TPA: hypothetical protein VLJ10_05550, partial [Candidatus Bathyarchaeia archaeon]|nr:hypothetical protein [Candidatus Bathyarchaeia archaeon]